MDAKQTPEFIDRIVAAVLEQLGTQAAAADSAPVASERDGKSCACETTKAEPKTNVEIRDDVVTAAILEARAIDGRQVLFGTRSVLTPSARDFLKSRKIAWTHAPGGNETAVSNGKWLALLVRSTPAVGEALDAIGNEPGVAWSRELAGCHIEAAARAVGALCRGECDGIVVFTGKPEVVVCRANRNPQVRGISVATVLRFKAVREEIGANLLALDPSERTAFELRNLLREIGRIKPTRPAGWME